MYASPKQVVLKYKPHFNIIMETLKEKQNKAFDVLKEKFGYSNKFQAPRLLKVVVNSGTGSSKDKARGPLVSDRLTKITGQKPAPRGAKKSIAAFKLREGDIVGYASTLRGSRMNEFVDKLIHVAIPRTRDFQGIKRKSIDEMGNLTLGIKEQTIFPETGDEDLRDVFGFSIVLTSTANNREEAEAFYEYIGIPFEKKEGE